MIDRQSNNKQVLQTQSKNRTQEQVAHVFATYLCRDGLGVALKNKPNSKMFRRRLLASTCLDKLWFAYPNNLKPKISPFAAYSLDFAYSCLTLA